MNRSGLSNSGELTIVRLDQSGYSTTEDISGTVEFSNAQRKEITSITLELATWRHVNIPHKTQPSVEQIFRQTLDLFPNPNLQGDRRHGHDEKVLKTNALFAFTFSATKRQPTIDYLEDSRIKHYVTCYVYRKSGLLSRERVVEKNQFQVPIHFATLEVDSLYPDKLFSCIQSRPHSSNSAYYDFRARCSTHLISGLPFLLELDMANDAEIDSVTLSLHQSTMISVGDHEDELNKVSRYVHEVTWPAPRREGHFRHRDSARTLAHGRKSWLIEWTCPDQRARVQLPFEATFYSKSAQANLERNLSLKVEVTLRNAPNKLAAVMRGLEYCPKWIDSRSDQTTSLRLARSVYQMDSPAASLRGSESVQDFRDTRRGSIMSHRSNNSSKVQIQMPATQLYSERPVPMISPGYEYQPNRNNGDYFGGPASRRVASPPNADVKLSHGSYSPGAVHLFSRADSVRSNHSSRPGSVRSSHGQRPTKAPDKITLPPAAIRASMSSAFESLNMRHPAGNGTISPGRRHFDDLPEHSEAPAPPPSQPLPAAPNGDLGTPMLMFGSHSPSIPLSRTTSGTSGITTDEATRYGATRQKKPTRLSRPAVILGVSQDTIQTCEAATSSPLDSPVGTPDDNPLGFVPSCSAQNKASVGISASPRMHDRDSGFSEASCAPGSPASVRANPTNSQAVRNTNGYALRPTRRTGTGTSADDAELGQIMFG